MTLCERYEATPSCFLLRKTPSHIVHEDYRLNWVSIDYPLPPIVGHLEREISINETTMPPVQTSRIRSVLSAYESTIQKNVESGEHCGMYLTNKVRRSGLGGSSHSKDPYQRDAPRHIERDQHRSARSPGGKGFGSAEAKRAAEKLKKRASNMHTARPKKTERPNGGKEDIFNENKIPATLHIDSLTPAHKEKSRTKSSDRSTKTETTEELTLEDLESPDNGKDWKSFEDSFFSEIEESSVAMDGDDDDCFSLLDDSSFQEPNWNAELKTKKKTGVGTDWTSGFAVVASQPKPDESDSERDSEDRKDRPRKMHPKPRDVAKRPSRPQAAPYQNRANDMDSDRDGERGERPRRAQLSKQPSNRSMQKKKADTFAITYQHRVEESDSDFDPEDMRERIRKKHIGASSSALQMSGSNLDLHPPVATFQLTRSTSSRSLYKGDSDAEDLNNSIRSLNSRALKSASLKHVAAGPGGPGYGMGDNFLNMVMGGAGNHFSPSFLGSNDSCVASESESERSDADRSCRRSGRVRKPRSQHRDHDNGGFSNSGDFLVSKPKLARKKKYGAAAAAENLSALPPAFQTVMRSQVKERKGESNICRNSNASRQTDGRPRLPKKITGGSPKKNTTGNVAEIAEMDDFASFKTDRSFFDCV